jgi:hypothetical protein
VVYRNIYPFAVHIIPYCMRLHHLHVYCCNPVPQRCSLRVWGMEGGQHNPSESYTMLPNICQHNFIQYTVQVLTYGHEFTDKSPSSHTSANMQSLTLLLLCHVSNVTILPSKQNATISSSCFEKLHVGNKINQLQVGNGVIIYIHK